MHELIHEQYTDILRRIRYVIGITTKDSVNFLPAGVQVISCRLEVTTSYSGGATIEIGIPGDPDLFMTLTDNNPQRLPTSFIVNQDTNIVNRVQIRTTINGAPVVGAAIVSITYVKPRT